MNEFKFKIGDLVMAKIALVESALLNRAGNENLSLPLVFMVVGQVGDACSAGAQLQYRCARLGQVVSFHEMELVSISDYNEQENIDLWIKSRAHMRRERDRLWQEEYEITHEK